MRQTSQSYRSLQLIAELETIRELANYCQLECTNQARSHPHPRAHARTHTHAAAALTIKCQISLQTSNKLRTLTFTSSRGEPSASNQRREEATGPGVSLPPLCWPSPQPPPPRGRGAGREGGGKASTVLPPALSPQPAKGRGEGDREGEQATEPHGPPHLPLPSCRWSRCPSTSSPGAGSPPQKWRSSTGLWGRGSRSRAEGVSDARRPSVRLSARLLQSPNPTHIQQPPLKPRVAMGKGGGGGSIPSTSRWACPTSGLRLSPATAQLPLPHPPAGPGLRAGQQLPERVAAGQDRALCPGLAVSCRHHCRRRRPLPRPLALPHQQ